MPESPELRILAYKARQYGAAAYAEVVLVLIQHILTDFPSLVSSFESCGVARDDLFIVGIPYSTNARVAARLRSAGYNIETPSVYPMNDTVTRVLRRALKRCQDQGKRLLIVEDGAYAVPLLHDTVDCDDLCVGAVEQTTRGAHIDEELATAVGLKFPVISIPNCGLKQTFESQFVGKAVVDNIRWLLQRARGAALAGKAIAVVGFGPIGASICKALDYENARVSVVDPDPQKLLGAAMQGFAISELGNVAQNSDMLIGASGSRSVTRDVLLSLRHGTILVSASSGQIEIDVDELRNISTKRRAISNVGTRYTTEQGDITLLADGYPVNFFRSDSVPNHVIDVILALLFEGALTLVQAPPKWKPDALVDGSKVIDEGDIAKLFLKFERLY